MSEDQRAAQYHQAMQGVGMECKAKDVNLVCFNASGYGESAQRGQRSGVTPPVTSTPFITGPPAARISTATGTKAGRLSMGVVPSHTMGGRVIKCPPPSARAQIHIRS